MKRAIILGSSAAAILAVAYLWPTFGSSSAEDGGVRGSMCIAGHCCCARRAQAETVAAIGGAQERETLDPNQFVGPAKQAYQVAEKNPALLAQLHATADVTGSTAIRICSIVIEATTVRSAKSAWARR